MDKASEPLQTAHSGHCQTDTGAASGSQTLLVEGASCASCVAKIEQDTVRLFRPLLITRALMVNSVSVGVGFRNSMFMARVQLAGSRSAARPGSRPCSRYSSAAAEHAEWQSTSMLAIPPLSTPG